MNNNILKKFIFLIKTLILGSISSLALAAGFVSFDSNNATNFNFISNSNNATFSINNQSIDLHFSHSIVGLPSSFYSDQIAYMTMIGVTTTKADDDGTGEITQDIDSTFTI